MDNDILAVNIKLTCPRRCGSTRFETVQSHTITYNSLGQKVKEREHKSNEPRCCSCGSLAIKEVR